MGGGRQPETMIPTNEQIELISGTIAFLMEDFSQTVGEAAGCPEPGEFNQASEEALARALAGSLKRGSEGDELGRLLRCAFEILELSLAVV